MHNLYLRTLVDRAITKSKKIVSAQRASIQKSARKWLNKGPANTHVYVARLNGKIVHVGITKNDILLRQLQHRVAMPDIFLAQITKTALTRNQARAIEQALINGGGKNGNKLKNRIDSIRSGRDILPGALEWATDWLKNNI